MIRKKGGGSKHNMRFSIKRFCDRKDKESDILNRRIFEKWYKDVVCNVRFPLQYNNNVPDIKFNIRKLFMKKGDEFTKINLKTFNLFMRMMYQSEDFIDAYRIIMGYDKGQEIIIPGNVAQRYGCHTIICGIPDLTQHIKKYVNICSSKKTGIYSKHDEIGITTFYDDPAECRSNSVFYGNGISKDIGNKSMISMILRETEPGSIRQMRYAFDNYSQLNMSVFSRDRSILISNNIDNILKDKTNMIRCCSSLMDIIQKKRCELYGDNDNAHIPSLIKMYDEGKIYSVFQPFNCERIDSFSFTLIEGI